MPNSRILLVVAIVAAAAISRILPHAPNLAPITAAALFGGAWLEDRKLAFAVPLGALVLSDSLLGFYNPGVMLSVYLSAALTVALGIWVGHNRTVMRIATGAVSGSIVFFVVTDFAVWVFGTTYPKTGAGLIQCYVAAIPFLRNSLASDLAYTAVFFGGFALLQRLLPRALPQISAVR